MRMMDVFWTKQLICTSKVEKKAVFFGYRFGYKVDDVFLMR